MPVRITTYSPKEVVLIVGGVIIEGLARDSFLKITPEADDWEDERSRDNEVTRSRIPDTRATLEVVLTRSSLANNTFNDLRAENDQAGTERGLRLVRVQDLNSEAVFEGTGCIMGPPEVVYGEKAGDRTWKFRIYDLKRTDKGAT